MMHKKTLASELPECQSENFTVSIAAVPKFRDLALNDLLCEKLFVGLGMTRFNGGDPSPFKIFYEIKIVQSSG